MFDSNPGCLKSCGSFSYFFIFFFCAGICILWSFHTFLYFLVILTTTAHTQTVELRVKNTSIQTYTVTSTVLEDTAGSLLGIFRESRTVYEFRKTTERHHLFQKTRTTAQEQKTGRCEVYSLILFLEICVVAKFIWMLHFLKNGKSFSLDKYHFSFIHNNIHMTTWYLLFLNINLVYFEINQKCRIFFCIFKQLNMFNDPLDATK